MGALVRGRRVHAALHQVVERRHVDLEPAAVALAGEELADEDLAAGGRRELAQAVRVAGLELALVPSQGGMM